MRHLIFSFVLLMFVMLPAHAAVIDGNDSKTITIESGESLSENVGLSTLRLAGIEMPSNWTDAKITFQIKGLDGVWRDKYDPAGNEYTVTTGAGRYIDLDTYAFRGMDNIRLRSGTSSTPVVQSADRKIKLILRDLK